MECVFQRIEKKYLMTGDQYKALTDQLAGRMVADEYGAYYISNLYYDTPDYDLIRASNEKPVYKEKLRVRCYQKAALQTPVFVEMKRKFKGVVYKRRVQMPYGDALAFLNGAAEAPGTQIGRELEYFLARHTLAPAVWLGYERTALKDAQDSGLRVTFDTGIRFRRQDLRLESGAWGVPLLAPGQVLMEVKAEGAVPLWLGQALSGLKIFPTSFSKYGTCYKHYILPQLTGEVRTSA